MARAIIIIIVALLFAAFFSGMETAFVTANRLKVELDRKRSPVLAHILKVFTTHPGEYISAILVGNNIAIVVYSMYMSLLASLVGEELGWRLLEGSIFLQTVVSAVVVIFLAEYIPKAMVRSRPNVYLDMLAVPLYLFYIVLYPVTKASTFVSVMVLKIAGVPVKNVQQMRRFEKVDLENLLEEVVETRETAATGSEIRLFRNALDFSDVRVRDCMVPRVEIEAVEGDASIKELAARFIETAYTRILIYRGTIDNIVGYVNSKSMFENPASIGDVIKKIDFVAETLPAQKMLSGFIRHKSSLAVVVDEFGGTAGIVSLEDILEEIFGEIEDEHDQQDMVEKQVGEGEYILSGRLEVEYLNEKYGLGIEESDQYQTLAGYIIKMYDGIPSGGQVLDLGDKEIRILRRSGGKLELVRVKVRSRRAKT